MGNTKKRWKVTQLRLREKRHNMKGYYNISDVENQFIEYDRVINSAKERETELLEALKRDLEILANLETLICNEQKLSSTSIAEISEGIEISAEAIKNAE